MVKTCCCGWSLQVGVQIIGVFGLVMSAFSIYRESYAIKVYKQLEENTDELSQNLPFDKKHFLAMIRLGYVNLVFKVISLLVNLLLLGSTGSGDKRLAYPWVAWSIFQLFFDFGVIIFFIGALKGFAVFLLLYGIGWFLSIYFIAVVRWYIEELNEQTENDGPEPPGGESTIEFQSSSSGFPRSSDNQRPKSNGSTFASGGGSAGSCGGAGGSGGCGGGGE